MWAEASPLPRDPPAALPRPDFYWFPGDAVQGSRSRVGFMWAYVFALYYFMLFVLGQPPSLVGWLTCPELPRLPSSEGHT